MTDSYKGGPPLEESTGKVDDEVTIEKVSEGVVRRLVNTFGCTNV